MGVSDLRSDRRSPSPACPSLLLRPRLWGGLDGRNPRSVPPPAAMDVDADAAMADIENDRSAFARTNQTRSPSAGATPTPAAADDKPLGQRSGTLNHHTPVTRFLCKQNLGVIPKLSARPAPLGDTSGGPREALTSPLGGGLRLPSLAHAPPLSPHKWTGADDGGAPPFLGPPARVSSCGSLSERFASMSTAMPSLKEALERGARPDPGASALSSSARVARGLQGMLTMRDICRPTTYHRSASCPSDPSALLSAGPAEDESEEDERRSPPPATASFRSLSLQDLAQSRLERSSSLGGDGGGGPSARPAAESIDLYEWLDRQPLQSLADSALALERRASPPASVASPPASEPRREKKLCAFPQCTSNAVTRGLCISHGGGRRCQRKGCTRGAQSKGLCVAHGGGRICHAKGCSNIQRSMGLCIRHGGGRRCCVPGCQKGVVRQDLCTAHGGKRKCRVDGCSKHVKKKGLCRAHANALGPAA